MVTRLRASGIALLLGSVGFLITMALHPAPGGLEGLVRERAVTVGSHAIGLAMIPVMFFGFLGVTERLGSAAALAPAALVTYGFASVAAMCAGVINGLAAPAFAARMISSGATGETADVVLAYGFQLNAAFATVFMVAVSAALVLWALAIFRSRGLPVWAGAMAGVLGGVGLVAVPGGYLGTSVHEFGIFVLGFAAWAVAVGLLLLRAPRAEPAIRHDNENDERAANMSRSRAET